VKLVSVIHIAPFPEKFIILLIFIFKSVIYELKCEVRKILFG